ncbi:MAG: NUDIX hydrolase [Chloroflexi bacterium]|nr:NUDIX hydrolase [Chloroflexota bacterium]MDA1148087.1 NUDIX hydrolase [Chloroflexota bacterium]MQC83224.1 NUDIX hydrolase [Chloroflexota bacterium]
MPVSSTSAGGSAVGTAVAAGGVVFRIGDAGPEIVLVARRREQLWALPKGTPEPAETIEETALREVREETGLETEIVERLGTVRYSFTSRGGDRVDKTVHHFLLEPTGGSFDAHDDEFDHVDWYDIHEAQRRLTHRNQLHILERAGELIAARNAEA